MVEILAREATTEELTRKCLDVSMMICLILEELGIWAVCYLGTLIYDPKTPGDLYDPPANSEARGHSWVFTPAFSLIDLTAKHQPLPKAISDDTPFPLLIEEEDTISRPERGWYVDLNDSPPLRAAKAALLEKDGFNRDFNLVHRPVRHVGPVDLFFVPMTVRFAPSNIHGIRTKMTLGGKPVVEFCERVKAELLP